MHGDLPPPCYDQPATLVDRERHVITAACLWHPNPALVASCVHYGGCFPGMTAHTTVLHENEIWALDGESELESLNIDWILDTGSSLEEIK